MLALTRKKNESILIGNTWVKILEIEGNRVRVGVYADNSIEILREELVALDDPRRGNHPDAPRVQQ